MFATTLVLLSLSGSIVPRAAAQAAPRPAERPLLFADLHELCPRIPYALGTLATGDLDGDGDLDAFFGPTDEYQFMALPSLWLNDGSGRFRVGRIAEPVAGRVSSIDLGDLDDDGDLDVLYDEHLYRNDGQAGFALEPPPIPESVAREFGDLDGDGDLDVYLIAGGDRLLLNDGTGQFVDASANLPPGASASRYLSLGDVDGDLDLDVLRSGSFADRRLYVNDGFALFTDASAQLPPVPGSSMRLVDVDHDLDLDALGTDSLYLNDGAGTFVDAHGLLPFPPPIFNLVIDADGDDDPDLLNIRSAELWKNDGAGVFTVGPSGLPSSSFPSIEAAAGDVDADGDVDLLLADSTELASIFLPDQWFHTDLALNDGTGIFTRADDLTRELGGSALEPVWDAHESKHCGALLDADGDGDLDAFLGERVGASQLDDGYGRLSMLVNDGDGRFTDQGAVFPEQFFTLPTCMAAADFDLDGDGDVLVGGHQNRDGSGGGVDLFVQGSGSFTRVYTGASGETNQLALGDADADGDADALHCSPGTEPWARDGMLRNDAGSLATEPSFPIEQLDCEGVAFADVDRDGDLDALFAVPVSSGARARSSSSASETRAMPLSGSRLLRNDDPGWTDVSPQLSFASARSISPGDVDLDGDPELLIVDGTGAKLLDNDGAGSFTLDASWPAPEVRRAALVDLDADGDLDGLISGSRAFVNDGVGSFGPGRWKLPPISLDQVAFGDVDLDGDADLLTKGSLLTNLTRQVAWRTPAKLGRTQVFDLHGPNGAPWTLLSSLQKGQVFVPGHGTLLLGPPFSVLGSGTFDRIGRASFAGSIPSDPALIGTSLYLQAVMGTPSRFSNRETSTVTGL